MIDYSVFPDVDELPTDFSSLEAKADYLTRVCGAWDFGMVPTLETFELFATWQDAFDRFPLTTSAAYAAFRSWYGWSPIPGDPPLLADYERLDRWEGRTKDPCFHLV